MAGEEAHGGATLKRRSRRILTHVGLFSFLLRYIESHEEYLNPIAAWIEYNLNKEEENKEIAHEHLRTTKANAEAKYAYSFYLISLLIYLFCSKRSVKVFTTAMKMNHDNRCEGAWYFSFANFVLFYPFFPSISALPPKPTFRIQREAYFCHGNLSMAFLQ